MIKTYMNCVCDLCGVVRSLGEMTLEGYPKIPSGWIEPTVETGMMRQHICESCMERIDDGRLKKWQGDGE